MNSSSLSLHSPYFPQGGSRRPHHFNPYAGSPINSCNDLDGYESWDSQISSPDTNMIDTDLVSNLISIKSSPKKQNLPRLSEEDMMNLFLKDLTPSLPNLTFSPDSDGSPSKKVCLSPNQPVSLKLTFNCEETGLERNYMLQIKLSPISEAGLETEMDLSDFRLPERELIPPSTGMKLTRLRIIPWILVKRVIKHIKDIMAQPTRSKHDYLKRILIAEEVFEASSPSRSSFQKFLKNFEKDEETYKYIKTIIKSQPCYGKVLLKCVEAFLSSQGEADFNNLVRENAGLPLVEKKKHFRSKFRNTLLEK